MKTNEKFSSFLATSSRKFFKYGLGLSILFAIVAFKIPIYAEAPVIPNYTDGEIFEIDYVNHVVAVEKITEEIKEIEKPKQKPKVIKTVTPDPIVTTVAKTEPVVVVKKNTTIVVKDPPPTVIEKDWEFVEKMPEFVGGEAGLFAHFANEINYNQRAIEWGIEGKVYVRFVVNKKGEIIKAEIARGVHPLLDDEALRVVQNMPNWNPGVQNGENVNVSMVVPVNFVLK